MESGTRLGPYEILEQLGAGGMGEVWLAEDTRLGRKVAVKVLPAEFASDPERLARFEQEARAAAALNHPHIAAVFDVGVEGEGDAHIHYMVQEHLQGKTLRDALADGPLPQDKALALGTEIAQALRVAHRAGIVHRDLKPENIFVTEDGHAKVLDFGLAKLTETATGAMNSQSMSPTVLGTQAGSIMGTAGYMAPEQVRGEDVDARADIFALGCVLFEVLTGTRAFAGKSPPHTLHKILDEDPDNFDAATAELPLRLCWLLEKCLAKDVDSRTQSAGDAVVDLQRVAREVEAGTAVGAAGQASDGKAAAATTSQGVSLVVVIALLVVAVGGGVLGGRFLGVAPVVPEPVAHFEFPMFGTDSGFTNPDARPLAIARDGSAVVFGDEGLLRLRQFGEPGLMDVRGTTGPRGPVFSPDGQWIAFHSSDRLQKVPLTGGAAIALATVGRPNGMSWERDGFILMAVEDLGIVKVPENGGDPEVLIEPGEGEQLQGPSLLPGGEWVLFSSLDGESSDWSDARVVAQSLLSGERRVLVPAGVEARYVAPAHVTFANETNLFAVPFDAAAVAVTGGQVPLIEGIGMASAGGAYYDVSETGDLVYFGGGGGSVGNMRPAWHSLDGGLEVLPFEPAVLFGARIGPDGNRIAVTRTQPGGVLELWIYEIDRGATQRLTPAGLVATGAVWSPDGEWIYFENRSEGETVWRIRADFSGGLEPIGDGTVRGRPQDVSADGGTLLVVVQGNNDDIATVDLETGDSEVLVGTPAFEFQATFAPDNRFVAYTSNESGFAKVYVIDRESGSRAVVSAEQGAMPLWSPDGATLYYDSLGADKMMSVPVTYEPSFRLGSAEVMFEMPAMLPTSRASLDIWPDGQRFLLLTDSAAELGEGGTPRRSMIQVVLNWGQVLRDRVTSR